MVASSPYPLLQAASGKGVLIDPVFEQHERDPSLIRERGIHLAACLDTHAHADHKAPPSPQDRRGLRGARRPQHRQPLEGAITPGSAS